MNKTEFIKKHRNKSVNEIMDLAQKAGLVINRNYVHVVLSKLRTSAPSNGASKTPTRREVVREKLDASSTYGKITSSESDLKFRLHDLEMELITLEARKVEILRQIESAKLQTLLTTDPDRIRRALMLLERTEEQTEQDTPIQKWESQ